MINYIIIYIFLGLTSQIQAQSSTEKSESEYKETFKNEAFCNDFFDPAVRKQLIMMNLIELPTYVEMKKKTHFEDDTLKEVVIFGKNKLVIIEEPKTSGLLMTVGRSMFLLKDFINEAEGTNCLTNLILPHVFVMCDQATYLFTPRDVDGEMIKKKYEVSLPGLNLIDDPGTKAGLKRQMRIFQHIPDVGVIFMEKTVNFGSEEDIKKLGITKEQLSDLPKAQKNLDFRYLTITSEDKASLTSEPTQEGAEQWKLGPPMAYIDESEMYIIDLNSRGKPQYFVELKGDVWQLNEVENRYLKEDFCFFSLDDILYENGKEAVETPRPEVTTKNLPEVAPEKPTEVTTKNSTEEPSEEFPLVIVVIILIVAVVIAGSLYAILKRGSPKIAEKLKEKKPEVKPKALPVQKKVVSPTIPASVNATSGVGKDRKDEFGKGKIVGLLDTSAVSSSTAASTLSRGPGGSNSAVSGSAPGSKATGSSVASSVVSTSRTSDTFVPGSSAVPGSKATGSSVAQSTALNSRAPNPGSSVAQSTAPISRVQNPGSSVANSTAPISRVPNPGSPVANSTAPNSRVPNPESSISNSRVGK